MADKFEFQTEVNDLLNLMIHSLYSNKEIFLRELISNASDALDKLNYLSLTDEAYKSLNYTPRIDISVNKEAKTLTISDNGIGMNKDELIANLGTIARSGTKGFMQNLSGDAKKDSSLIGQFGVGFYSAFMVANKIEVVSKKALSDEVNKWTSDAKSYEISNSTKESHGTSITLYLNDEEFADTWKLEGIIKKYSNHIPYAIFMDKEEYVAPSGDEKEGKYETKNVQINKASALWRMNKASIKTQEYNDFYKQISHDSTDPLLHIHTKAEGKIEYSTLFYVPGSEPFDLFRVDYQSGVKLYVKRVFITDDAKELLPPFLRFIRGVIDVEDLPLNVSREILQENAIMRSVKEQSVKKILSELAKLKEKDREKYIKFYTFFGKVLKEALYGFGNDKEAVLDLVLFKSSKRDGLISLKEYKEGMKEDQKSIYYISGNSENMLRNSPLLESFKKNDIEVLIMDEEIDTIVMPMTNEFDKIPMKSISHADIDDEIKSEENSVDESKLTNTLVKMREILKDDVKDVKLSSRLSDSVAVLIYDKNDPDFAMQMMLKQMGQNDLPKVKPILEINPNHEIFTKLETNELMINDISRLLLDMAKINEGMNIEDPAQFSKILTKIMTKAI
ncbi:molecular chaperone HtpG [Campylobacter sp. RM9344]|uniref:Chaperone protein HtpG n=1 Tax=Campylobacter californiensis TaxID=1032243 RepID=A0AAW3ZW89_9BACT|nr:MULTISPECIES: molecular chaperone HtpG [unclassified Campylobacter]MBE2984300.1 molecular chaperone HtpG [Campylobacter sp. RM6883]MBE2994833.1 molecular chaperone HtpG [Campylobacter sp. RM6913]MBE3029391.1 molecular chaperone HtpG [Campylobacter sp. RM9344]MBE3607964.1 molecular chaperone HtpG [Campylobacter sp. RM9337]MBE3609276.1 molecular chaperone HtpG [Campylobacter sp. RM12916]